jgi:hypothetical protein
MSKANTGLGTASKCRYGVFIVLSSNFIKNLNDNRETYALDVMEIDLINMLIIYKIVSCSEVEIYHDYTYS